MQFKITFRNQILALEFILVILIFSLGCTFYFKCVDEFFHTEYFIWLFLIQFIPVLYLHVEYLLINRDSSLVVNRDLSFLKYIKNSDRTIDLNFNQIAKIILYLPPSAYRGYIGRRFQLLPTESYSYAVIYSSDGDKMTITSLMMPEIEKVLDSINGVPIDRKKRLFASPTFEKLTQWFKKEGL